MQDRTHNFYINHYLCWNDRRISRDGQPMMEPEADTMANIPMHVYEKLDMDYPKFFKMDLSCKVAFLATELLKPFPDAEKERTAVILGTYSGCIEVDKQFENSIQTFASPALFVYTLPNIMLGEICIRNGFKGEQLCLIDKQPDWAEMSFLAEDLLSKRNMDTCLLGFIDANRQHITAHLAWIGKTAVPGESLPLSAQNLERIFDN